MHIKRLSLYDFRNFVQLDLDLDAGMNLFVGANAQGKTNLLEACHLLATARSHRLAKDSEMIRWQQKSYYVAASVSTNLGIRTLQLHYDPAEGKKVHLDAKLQPRLLDLIGNLKLVFFAPEHLSIVKGDPGGRRRFLDMLLSSLHRKYLYDLSQYGKVLREKSNLLREEKPDLDLLSVLNLQLAQLGSSLMQRRIEAIEQLKPLAARYHEKLNSNERLTLSYESRIGYDIPPKTSHLRDSLEHLLRLRQGEELRRHICLVGPQRDDIKIILNGEEAKRFASQGQQRSIVLALKIAEAHYIEQIGDERPLLILDDLFSELDPGRQSNLMANLVEFGQSLISATHLPPLLSHIEKRIYTVQQGMVRIQP